MSEIHFVVEEAPEGGYIAKAVDQGIFTDADDVSGLHARVRDAVRCHFESGAVPSVIHLHFTREEVIAA
ncbi:MAG: 2-oxoisovalerate dehydrogenase [Burkholderiales bacterium]|nr:MAG: 2-oxoisovalerate dehydrogenase [Burkholderiales bacterium]